MVREFNTEISCSNYYAIFFDVCFHRDDSFQQRFTIHFSSFAVSKFYERLGSFE